MRELTLFWTRALLQFLFLFAQLHFKEGFYWVTKVKVQFRFTISSIGIKWFFQINPWVFQEVMVTVCWYRGEPALVTGLTWTITHAKLMEIQQSHQPNAVKLVYMTTKSDNREITFLDNNKIKKKIHIHAGRRILKLLIKLLTFTLVRRTLN